MLWSTSTMRDFNNMGFWFFFVGVTLPCDCWTYPLSEVMDHLWAVLCIIRGEETSQCQTPSEVSAWMPKSVMTMNYWWTPPPSRGDFGEQMLGRLVTPAVVSAVTAGDLRMPYERPVTERWRRFTVAETSSEPSRVGQLHSYELQDGAFKQFRPGTTKDFKIHHQPWLTTQLLLQRIYILIQHKYDVIIKIDICLMVTFYLYVCKF